MTRLDVRLKPFHVVTVQAVFIDVPVGSLHPGQSQPVNFMVNCVCGWRAPSRFRARTAAQTLGSEHQDSSHDFGYLEVICRGLNRDEAERWRIR